MTFSSKKELPNFEEFLQLHNECSHILIDAYDDAKVELGFDSEFGSDDYEAVKINKLLGYADLIQGGMLLNCETASKGVTLYSSKGGYSKDISLDELQGYKENCKKWQLLFQLDSIVTKNYEMLWGDVGRIYYYINADDLKNLNFDNCWLILQCS